MSVEVINVEVEDQLLDLSFGFEAKRTVVNIWVVGCVTVECAIIGLICVKNSSWNNLEIVQCFRKRWCSVNIPVCATISDHHTGKVNFVKLWLESSLHVVLVNLPS